MTGTIDWIAADWGTTNLRLWAMSGRVPVEARTDPRGMSGLAPGDYGTVLTEATAGWPAVPVIASGMVGSRQGWSEAPYAPVPCPATPRLVPVPGDPGGRPVRIVCGLRQDDPADVMRGEETQIAGLLAAHPKFDGVACLPGTHTKWVRISAEEICNFKSVMTGEIFGLIAGQSVLRHSVEGGECDMPAFLAAVSDALARPERGYGNLFQIRAEGLLGDLPPQIARARLSGTLIGWELAATKPWWLGSDITIIGASSLARLYSEALSAQGLAPRSVSVEDATLAGLSAAYDRFRSEG
ncbi:2-dehydro-3-deoxygalactonokinase [Paracoccus sp. 1_MG-2023]|uniref:2-dehydro-3-deoxygalactonokinase n=1 Tax=unclassified Paracoccus (in: a-proteobacteria) TaxID=2688777 RepID=UPI001C0A540B|nr:2-dehydro-3-deoxygalactonokinase [Paracoccus sp. 1_MG-2023]MBU2957789.1 2-dehydro-3-deoxygalactonokinase [Paracoccus sp. C2R09]MDO6667363.1 2-dehydro-3-deoxygalactonokinase [Paracoccus sp. 1_MG-2023]